MDRSQRIVIIGAGPSALSAMETLRDTGYKGEIVMISKEKGNGNIIQISHMIELC